MKFKNLIRLMSSKQAHTLIQHMFSILGCSVRGKKISNKFCNMYNYFTLFHVDFQKLLQNVKLMWLEQRS